MSSFYPYFGHKSILKKGPQEETPSREGQDGFLRARAATLRCKKGLVKKGRGWAALLVFVSFILS
ncbi:MAG: hypothetical protein COX39_02175 [Candidatus Nealsonbacteria bacterium CG23_combo_of_CG06-09_8_20_14_all_40_13]|uniref:Uncharacterized protein n=1 Tax=Candidatus Nealsonbacteria bacterium CG23_combo_of_CG06-09_8_20_14_all_40_13 TaxID=1974724 RepID=A0A2G9YQP6_9BACT|nr:MAG: hypothetical protein COX39_02175 [Candidatus Nealsonbacteria bacterium CG23_combo_of_CG06-09_8_20_14_all_40_13]